MFCPYFLFILSSVVSIVVCFFCFGFVNKLSWPLLCSVRFEAAKPIRRNGERDLFFHLLKIDSAALARVFVVLVGAGKDWLLVIVLKFA